MMPIPELVLEYLKLVLSPQGVVGILGLAFLLRHRDDVRALMRRVATIRLPGGAEVSTPQLERAADEMITPRPSPVAPAEAARALPAGIHLTPDQAKAVAEAFGAERAKAYLWEYRYLNFFLVPGTQRVLDWLASLKDRTTFGMFDAWWLPIIPSPEQRRTIVNVLEAHNLITLEGELITVTPKGHEYIQWRGPLPAPAS